MEEKKSVLLISKSYIEGKKLKPKSDFKYILVDGIADNYKHLFSGDLIDLFDIIKCDSEFFRDKDDRSRILISEIAKISKEFTDKYINDDDIKLYDVINISTKVLYDDFYYYFIYYDIFKTIISNQPNLKWSNNVPLKIKYILNHLSHKKIKLKINSLRNIEKRIPLFIYHYFLSTLDRITKLKFYRNFKHYDIIGVNIILSKKGYLTNLIKRMAENLNYSYHLYDLSSSKVSFQIKNTLQNLFSKDKTLDKLENFLSITDIIKLFHIFIEISSKANDFSNYTKNKLKNGNTLSDTFWNSIIPNWFIKYSVMIKEMKQISNYLIRKKPKIVIAEHASGGKLGLLFYFLNNYNNVETITLQHGILTEPFYYIASSSYFGCASQNSFEILEEYYKEENKKLFIAGLPEQLRSEYQDLSSRRFIYGIGLVDSSDNEFIKLIKLKVVSKSEKFMHEKVLVKPHPRSKYGCTDYFTKFYYSIFPKGKSWDVYLSQIKFAISFSLDAVYEILIRRIPVIVVDIDRESDKKILDNTIPHAQVVSNSKDLDILIERFTKDYKIDDQEYGKILKWLEYKFGCTDDTNIQRLIKDILER